MIWEYIIWGMILAGSIVLTVGIFKNSDHGRRREDTCPRGVYVF